MKYFISAVVCVVVIVIIAGIVVVGSPIDERKSRFDEQRTSDLAALQSHIITYWQNKGALPKNLGDLADPILGFSVPLDPETKKEYGYRPLIGTGGFQLCAVFSLPSEISDTRSKPVRAPYPMGAYEGSWDHGMGEQCFDRTIDPDFFPPQKDRLQK